MALPTTAAALLPRLLACACAFILAATIAIMPASAQVRIPKRPPGFTLGSGAASAGVQLEAYVDLLCPFSKAAYPAVKQLADYYAPQELRVALVLFPLPYHQNAFVVAESAFAVTSLLGNSAFAPWLEVVYAEQERFWNKAASNLTAVQVAGKLRELAQQTFPELPSEQRDALVPGYGGTEADFDARAAWDYTCTRRVSGTPMYMLNGVPFERADASWSFHEWLAAIDPLVQANRQQPDAP